MKLYNRFKSVENFKSNKTYLKSMPTEIIIEITNHCNLACPMCSRGNMERDESFMKLDLFKKIVDQTKDTCELIYLSGGLGDPMLHPKFFEFVEYAKLKKVKVGISTNATMIKEKNIDRLISSVPDILLLSIDGATKETHEKIRVGSNFEKTISGIEKYLIVKHEKKIKTHVICQMVYMPINSSEAGMFKKKWSSFKGVNDVRLKKFISFQGAPYQPEKGVYEEEYKSCILPWRQLSVSCDGTVAICCRDYHYKDKIGDTNLDSIASIWNSKAMMDYRKKLSDNEKHLISSCKGCGTIKTNFITLFGASVLNTFTIRKYLPLFEKVLLKFKLPLNYD